MGVDTDKNILDLSSRLIQKSDERKSRKLQRRITHGEASRAKLRRMDLRDWRLAYDEATLLDLLIANHAEFDKKEFLVLTIALREKSRKRRCCSADIYRISNYAKADIYKVIRRLCDSNFLLNIGTKRSIDLAINPQQELWRFNELQQFRALQNSRKKGISRRIYE